MRYVNRPVTVALFAVAALNASASWAQNPYWYVAGVRTPLSYSDTFAAAQMASAESARELVAGRRGRMVGVDHGASQVFGGRTVALVAAMSRSRAAGAEVGAALRGQPGVLRVLPVYGRGRYALVETDELVVSFRMPITDTQRQALAARYRIEFLRHLGQYCTDGWLCRVLDPNVDSALQVANAIHENEAVEFAHPNFLGTREYRGGRQPRLIPNDPLFSDQWHLNATGQLGTKDDADVDAPEAWDTTTGSSSITICVNDDAVDYSHEDFNVGGKLLPGLDQIDGDNDPSPESSSGEEHGTAVAGVATAVQGNGRGVTGAAPGARLTGVRMGFAEDDEADAFYFAAQSGADLINNSWGPPDGFGVPQPLPDVVRAAIDYAADQGRGGRGCVIFFAAGNGNESADLDGYASYSKVISVAASNDQDQRSVYSDFGNSVDVCAPSSDDFHNGITTTDQMGLGGYQSGNYTNDFGGTSSACPLACGVAALVLSVDPTLTRQQVQAVLQNTADKIDPAGGAYVNGRSKYYGYGKVNAQAAVLNAVAGKGTAITLQVSTKYLGSPLRPGVTATSDASPVQVSYTNGRGVASTANVWDGNAVQIGAQPGTTVQFPTMDAAAMAAPQGTSQRWITTAPASAVVGSQPQTLTGEYFHQLRRSFRVAAQAGGDPVTDAHPVDLAVVQLDQAAATTVSGTAKQVYADTGSSYTFGVEAAGGTSEERWASADTTGDGVSDPRTGTVSQQEPEVTASFYHLVRPKVILNGTNKDSTVATSKRKLLGQSQLVTGLSGSFQDWCDNGSPLAFTDQSTGSPLLAASGAREFIVQKGLVETIDYVVQPQLNTSSVRVRRYGSTPAVPVTATVAPANGRTAAQIYVTVRDSAGSPITGIDPKRIGLFASVPGTPASTDPSAVEGLKITNPTTATDQNGLVTFQATRSLPGTVTFHATLDGLAIGQPAAGTAPAQISQASVEFLQVMTVPLPQRGLYLLSFPITPDTPTNPGISHQLISDFEVSPTPPQVARLLPGSSSFEFFRADKPSETFRIAPGRGFFLRTTTAGSLELTGQRSQGPTYNLPLPGMGYHMLGNPQESRALNWNMADFEVFAQGTSVGLLSSPATWQYVNPFVWAYSGHAYELVIDPNIPGGQGLRNQIGVFEGFLWLALKNGVGVVYTPNSNRAERAEPISPANFGVSLFAATDDARASVIVGAQRQALRCAPAPAVDDGAPVAMELITADQTRAAADWLGRPVTQPTTWRVAVRTRQAGREVTLSWPYLNRQLPAGSRVRLTDLTTGRRVLLNTSSQLRYLSEAGERQFDLTVLPPSAGGLRVTGFRAVPSRGRAVTFEAQLTADAELLLRVSSLTGRVVAEVGPVAGEGLTTLAWDGLDRDGRPVPRGTYQVTLVARSADGELVRAVRTLILR